MTLQVIGDMDLLEPLFNIAYSFVYLSIHLSIKGFFYSLSTYSLERVYFLYECTYFLFHVNCFH